MTIRPDITVLSTILGDVPREVREDLRRLTVPTTLVKPWGAPASASRLTQRSAMREFLERGPIDTPVFIARHADDNAIIGWALLLPPRDVAIDLAGAQIVSIFVDPDHRRRGVGRVLITAAHEWARKTIRLRITAGADIEATRAFAMKMPEFLKTEDIDEVEIENEGLQA